MASQRTTNRAPRTPPLLLESLEIRQTPSAAWPADRAEPATQTAPASFAEARTSQDRPVTHTDGFPGGPSPAPSTFWGDATENRSQPFESDRGGFGVALSGQPTAKSDLAANDTTGSGNASGWSGAWRSSGDTPTGVMGWGATTEIRKVAGWRSMADTDSSGTPPARDQGWVVPPDARSRDGSAESFSAYATEGAGFPPPGSSPFAARLEWDAGPAGPGFGRPLATSTPTISAVVLAASPGGGNVNALVTTAANADPAGAAHGPSGSARGASGVAWGTRPGDLAAPIGSPGDPVAVSPGNRPDHEAAANHSGNDVGPIHDGESNPDAMPEPQDAGPRTAFSPFDRATIEQAIDRVLDELGSVGEALPAALGPPGMAPAALAAMTAALAFEVARRRRKRSNDDNPWPAETAGGSFPGLPSLSGGA